MSSTPALNLRHSETGAFVLIENSGRNGAAAAKFLWANERHFSRVRTGDSNSTYGISPDRLPKFLDHCKSNGVEVLWPEHVGIA